jgi:transcriptional regulator with XRE-family HTH domain
MQKDIASEKFLKKLGLSLRAIRLKKGWTLEETEEHGWPSWRHLQKIESGKNITIQTLWKLSRVYKINLSNLFYEIENT